MTRTPPSSSRDAFVAWFRASSPYIRAHRGRTFVIAFGGEAVADEAFPALAHDLALLSSLGVRLVLVHGARPQIEERLARRGARIAYVGGLRVTDAHALECVKEAAGAVRVEIESRLSTGLANAPSDAARIRVISGNFVVARPVGVRDGVDYGHTGEVRRIDTTGIRAALDADALVLLSPVGCSPTGEAFNLHADEVAARAAIALGADKLIYLSEDGPLLHARRRTVGQIDPDTAAKLLATRRLAEGLARQISGAVMACTQGVARCHIVDRHTDGALLQELFSRDGIGTLVTTGPYEGLRDARIEDVGGLLELIAPIEAEGTLVRRPRERIEMEIDRFTVIERDGMIIACAALYPWLDEGMAELACLAVHPDYRAAGRATALLDAAEQRARGLGIRTIFVLTTRAAHWFRERGFEPSDPQRLPMARRALYNWQRGSKVFMKRQ